MQLACLVVVCAVSDGVLKKIPGRKLLSLNLSLKKLLQLAATSGRWMMAVIIQFLSLVSTSSECEFTIPIKMVLLAGDGHKRQNKIMLLNILGGRRGFIVIKREYDKHSCVSFGQ
jgi:hypothetical protein